MVPVVVQLCDLRNDTITICLAEGRVVQTVYDDWSLRWKSEAIRLNLGKDRCHRRGVEKTKLILA